MIIREALPWDILNKKRKKENEISTLEEKIKTQNLTATQEF